MATLQEVLDDAISRIAYTKANSRWTKMPMEIYNPQAIQSGVRSQGEPVSGEYFPQSQTSRITLEGNPSYKDFASAVSHESVHDVMNKAGMLNSAPEMRQLGWGEMLKNILHAPQQQAWQSWDRSKRAGSMNRELPAYMTAFKPGQLEGTSPEDRKRWMDRWLPTLPKNIQEVLTRIMQQNDSTQEMFK